VPANLHGGDLYLDQLQDATKKGDHLPSGKRMKRRDAKQMMKSDQ
jgi:hypothetical protein